jgi:eukaryotic translation initiation factor 2C
VPAIKAACTRINPKYNPTLTFIVVQKRHNTRFYTADKNFQDGKSGNVQAGKRGKERGKEGGKEGGKD